ncbi:branched-chain amino acid ABC transporter permease [Aminithiophilus ramosus]|uniref:Branched-chain amino acid ABC transporter permease n=2 Tax=Synergistales TaxID=649776 RepID=A0A9Q7AB96_9BACT|nr:branched-chain amino acid ABC transporter permease [Aminithiophilus ramosus]QTX31454.1 branched-chain amino acid ABC transporter permease [Aminithiophilus ramosus]QVL35257.1 branched-chain amino acid ABC transporter permease [Synergistota bacterium]
MSNYTEGILILLMINGIAAMGVSLLTGFTGIFTLGHAAYLAIGSYTTAILTLDYGLHWFPAILIGGMLAMAVGYLVGLPTLKLMGDYYAIASIGLAESIRLIIENWQSVTNGARGIPGIDTFTTLPITAGFFVVMAYGAFCLIDGRFGRAFKACRDDHVAASLLGFNTPRCRVLSLSISAFYVGIAGGLYAGFISFIQPVMFDMLKSTEMTAVVVFGGLGSMSGALLGTTIITLVTELFRPISQYRMLIYGLVLVLVMIFRPEGILGQHEVGPALFRRLGRLFRRNAAATPEERRSSR